MADAPSIIINLPNYPFQNLTSATNIAALRTVASTGLMSGQDIAVDAGVTAGDGLGGLFNWSTTSLATDDGASVIKPNDRTSLQAGRWLVSGGGGSLVQLGAAGGAALVNGASQWVALRSTLAALDAQVGKRVVITGDISPWEWQSGNFTARVASDALRGLYQPHATVAVTVGCWVRLWDGKCGKPEWFGAVTGGPDCYAAITAAIALCPEVVFSWGTYFVSQTVKLNREWVGLSGAGCEYNGTDNKVTRLLITSGTATTLQVGPDAYPGNINSLQRGNFVRGIYVGRSIVPVNASGATAIRNQWTFRALFNQVKVEESEFGFSFSGTIQTFATECFAFRSSAGSGGGGAIYRGFVVDGSSGLFAGGNASIYLTRCTSGVNSALSLPVNDGFYADNNFTDLFFHYCETVDTKVGFNIQGNSSTGANLGNTDLEIIGCRNDANKLAGILLNNLGASSTVEIRGGYQGPSAGATAGIFITNCAGSILINGGQLVMASGTAVGIQAVNSKNVNVRSPLILNCISKGVAFSNVTGGKIDPIIDNAGIVCAVGVELTASSAVWVAPSIDGQAGAATVGVSLAAALVTFTAALTAATSGTLTAPWSLATGSYTVTFSDASVRSVTLTNAATTATWTGAVTATTAATANNNRCEVNCTAIDSGAIVGGSANKLKINGTSITATGLSGTNLVSGVMT